MDISEYPGLPRIWFAVFRYTDITASKALCKRGPRTAEGLGKSHLNMRQAIPRYTLGKSYRNKAPDPSTALGKSRRAEK